MIMIMIIITWHGNSIIIDFLGSNPDCGWFSYLIAIEELFTSVDIAASAADVFLVLINKQKREIGHKMKKKKTYGDLCT